MFCYVCPLKLFNSQTKLTFLCQLTGRGLASFGKLNQLNSVASFEQYKEIQPRCKTINGNFVLGTTQETSTGPKIQQNHLVSSQTHSLDQMGMEKLMNNSNQLNTPQRLDYFISPSNRNCGSNYPAVTR